MRNSRAVTTVAAALLLAAVGLTTGTSAQANTPPSGRGPVEYRVHDALARAATLDAVGLDIVKRQGGDLFVVGDETTGAELSQLGFVTEVSKRYPAATWASPRLAPGAAP